MTASRCALWLWYRGDAFRGYQAQVQGPTVQETVRQVLLGLGIPKQPSPSGRTDLGVHARMQVASFLLDGKTGPTRAELKQALDAAAPGVLGCVVAAEAERSFNAQWTATGKEYRYRLALERPPDDAWAPYAWEPATHPRLQGASIRAEDVARVLGGVVGERDFSAFHEASSPRRVRSVSVAELVPLPSGLHEVRIRGSGFGRYQVRYLVGTAVAVAAGVVPEAEWRAALETAAPLPGLKAEARGLVLWEVFYPEGKEPFDRALVPSWERALPFWARSA